MSKRVASGVRSVFLLAIGVAAGAGGTVLVSAVQAATDGESIGTWVLDEGSDLASARCPEGSVMTGLTKTTSDAIVSMDPATYRSIVPLCTILKAR